MLSDAGPHPGVHTGQTECGRGVISVELRQADHNLILHLHPVDIHFDAETRIRHTVVHPVERVESDGEQVRWA